MPQEKRIKFQGGELMVFSRDIDKNTGELTLVFQKDGMVRKSTERFCKSRSLSGKLKGQVLESEIRKLL